MVLFPYRGGEQPPQVQAWAGDAGAKVTWNGQTDYVLLDVRDREVDADGLRAKASAAVLRTRGQDYSLSLPLGGSATFGGRAVEGTGPRGIEFGKGEARSLEGKDLMRQATSN